MTTFPIVETPRIPVTTRYHGVDVTEDYRWLEDGSSEDTIAWTRAQQHLTGTYYDAVPWRETLRARVERLLRGKRTTYRSLVSGGSSYFALKEQTPRQQPFLVALTDLDDTGTERIVVDPNAIDPSGETTIDWFVPSPDGRRLAVSLSQHGTEDGSLHVFDGASGEVVDEPIPHVKSDGRLDGLAPGRFGVLVYTLRRPRRVPATGVVPRDRRRAGPSGRPRRFRRRRHRGELPVCVSRRPLADGPGAEG
jgi:prolyl oligopeptidase